jgi:hypothetical protein
MTNHASRSASSGLPSRTITISGPDDRGVYFVQAASPAGQSQIEPHWSYASAVRQANEWADRIAALAPGHCIVINDFTSEAQQVRNAWVWGIVALLLALLLAAAYIAAG